MPCRSGTSCSSDEMNVFSCRWWWMMRRWTVLCFRVSVECNGGGATLCQWHHVTSSVGSVMGIQPWQLSHDFFEKSLTNLHEPQSNDSINISYLNFSQFELRSDKILEIRQFKSTKFKSFQHLLNVLRNTKPAGSVGVRLSRFRLRFCET